MEKQPLLQDSWDGLLHPAWARVQEKLRDILIPLTRKHLQVVTDTYHFPSGRRLNNPGQLRLPNEGNVFERWTMKGRWNIFLLSCSKSSPEREREGWGGGENQGTLQTEPHCFH